MTDFFITDEDQNINQTEWRNFKEYIKSIKGKNIVVTVSSCVNRRSSAQLKAYWSLMSQIQRPVNYAGNNYSQKEISDMLKLRFFYKEALGEKIPRSIANKSDCGKEEMRDFVEKILLWGEERGFKISITSAEMQNLINQYEEK